MKAAPNRVAEFRPKAKPAFPLYMADDLRAIELSAYESGLNARQGECETWGIVGFLVGLALAGTCYFLASF